MQEVGDRVMPLDQLSAVGIYNISPWFIAIRTKDFWIRQFVYVNPAASANSVSNRGSSSFRALNPARVANLPTHFGVERRCFKKQLVIFTDERSSFDGKMVVAYKFRGS